MWFTSLEQTLMSKTETLFTMFSIWHHYWCPPRSGSLIMHYIGVPLQVCMENYWTWADGLTMTEKFFSTTGPAEKPNLCYLRCYCYYLLLMGKGKKSIITTGISTIKNSNIKEMIQLSHFCSNMKSMVAIQKELPRQWLNFPS